MIEKKESGWLVRRVEPAFFNYLNRSIKKLREAEVVIRIRSFDLAKFGSKDEGKSDLQHCSDQRAIPLAGKITMNPQQSTPSTYGTNWKVVNSSIKWLKVISSVYRRYNLTHQTSMATNP